MATSRVAQTPNDHLQLALGPATENPGAVKQMTDEECHLLNLPVELQKTILEYVRTSVPSFNLGIVSANHSTAHHKRRQEERVSHLQADAAPCHASDIPAYRTQRR
jgi:hypothetical protein